jgi:hypothetical protein
MRSVIAFGYVCGVALAPVVGAVFIASLFRRRDRLIGLAPLAVVTGFFACGAVGWACVPAEWTLSFRTTMEAAGNAAKYGAAFEHAAEGTLMYFFIPALLGAVVFGLAALIVLWRMPVPPFARPVR